MVKKISILKMKREVFCRKSAYIMKKKVPLLIALITISVVALLISNKKKINSNIENIKSAEISTEDPFSNNWNDTSYSLSKSELITSFNSLTKDKNSDALVIFYDGGACNPYIDIVLDELDKLEYKSKKILITNFTQSHIDSKFKNYKSITILGDENRILARKLNIYDENTDRMQNRILIYKDGVIQKSDVYMPRIKGEIKRVIEN